MTVPSTQERTNQVGARFMDHKTNTTDVEIRLPRDEVRTDRIQTHNQGIQVPSSSGDLSSHSMYMEESIVGPKMPNINATIGWPHFCKCTKKTTIANSQKNYNAW